MADKSSPILTGKERLEIALEVFGTDDGIKPRFPRQGEKIQEYSERLVSAQLKKIAEWGNEPCPHYPESGWIQKRMCLECWQLLLEKEG